MNWRSYFLQCIEKFITCLDSCFCVENVSSLINLMRYMTRLQTLNMQFNLYNDVSDMSFWALQELLQMSTYNSMSFTHLCLINAVVFIDDLVNFAQRQLMIQEIVLSDSVIIHHDEKAKPTVKHTQSFWLHCASLIESHDEHIKVFIIFLWCLLNHMCVQTDFSNIIMCVQQLKLCRSPSHNSIHYSDLQAAQLINEGDIPAVIIKIDINKKREWAAQCWAVILVWANLKLSESALKVLSLKH